LQTRFAFRRKSFPAERTYFDKHLRLQLEGELVGSLLCCREKHAGK